MTGGRAKYAAAAAVLPIGVPILFLALVGGQASYTPAAACERSAPVVPAVVAAELDAVQMSVATQVVAAVRAFPPTADKPLAAVIALAAARQESGIRNLDYGGRDSLGVFQQRPSQGWGTPEQVLNIAHATTSFLEHLVRVPGWQIRRITDVAADVQRSAEEYRGLYQQWVPLATRLVAKLWPTVSSATLAAAVPTNCDQPPPVAAGQVKYPVPTAFVDSDQRNWGVAGSNWSSWHTGTDFSVPCGTPVLAATGGTIEIVRNQSWAGPWLVKVVTGPTSLSTWYAHMQKLDVSAGELVVSGQKIGEAGALGNTSGCHLHFEVHLRNGSIYGPDNVDPSNWLAGRNRA